MELSNRLIYNNLLRCASEDVATATMSIPGWVSSEAKPDWLSRTIDPENNVVFLDTDKVKLRKINSEKLWSLSLSQCGISLEERVSDHISNGFEAETIVSITTRLLQVMISKFKRIVPFQI